METALSGASHGRVGAADPRPCTGYRHFIDVALSNWEASRDGDARWRVEIRPVKVGAEHAILRGLRERGSETEVTRVLAAVMRADRRFAAEFLGASAACATLFGMNSTWGRQG
jgi:hypothetical protein